MSNDNNPILLSCPTCNAPLDFDGVHPVTRCKFCGNTSVLPASILNEQSSIPSGWDEVFELVGSGNYEKAVRQMQSKLGIDMKDSNDVINAIASGRMVTQSAPGAHSAEEIFRIMQRVQSLVENGNRDEALAFYRESFNMDADHAEKIIDQIASCVQEEAPPLHFQVPSIPTTQYAARKTNTAIIVTILSILVFVGGLLAFLFTGKVRGQYTALQNNLLLTTADGSAQSIAGTFYDAVSEKEFIGIVEASSGKMMWKSEPLSREGTFLASGTEMLYASDGSTLKAYQLADGTLVWQTEMSDRVAYGENSMIVTASRVIVMTADRRITAYDAASGRQAWYRQTSTYYDDLLLVNDSLLVRDYQPETYDEALYFLNPVTGDERYMAAPVCEREYGSATLDSSSPFIYDEAANALFMVFDEGCAQRFNLSTRQLDWSIQQEDALSSLYSGYASLIADSSLFIGNDGNLIDINKTSGEIRILTENDQYDLVPLAQTDGTLIVRAKRTQGTSRFEFWGMDASSGEVLWQKNMQDAEPIDPPDEMAGIVDDADFGFTWQLTDAGLVLATFKGEPGELMIETINPADGVSSGSQTLSIPGVGDEFYSVPSVIQWMGSVMYLNLDSNLYTLDLATAKIKTVY